MTVIQNVLSVWTLLSIFLSLYTISWPCFWGDWKR